MKKNIKIITVLMTFVLMFSLSACARKTENVSTTRTPNGKIITTKVAQTKNNNNTTNRLREETNPIVYNNNAGRSDYYDNNTRTYTTNRTHIPNNMPTTSNPNLDKGFINTRNSMIPTAPINNNIKF